MTTALIWGEKIKKKTTQKQLSEVVHVIGFIPGEKRDSNGIMGNNSSFFGRNSPRVLLFKNNGRVIFRNHVLIE